MATNQGMVDVELENMDTGEVVTYEVADIQCARMLAAEDHGGDPEDWITNEVSERGMEYCCQSRGPYPARRR